MHSTVMLLGLSERGGAGGSVSTVASWGGDAILCSFWGGGGGTGAEAVAGSGLGLLMVGVFIVVLLFVSVGCDWGPVLCNGVVSGAKCEGGHGGGKEMKSCGWLWWGVS